MDTKRNRPPGKNLDRFIPNRSAMDFGFAQHMLTQSNKGKKDFASSWLPNTLSRETYKKNLAEALGVNRTRILAFNDNPSTLKEPLSSTLDCKFNKRLRDIPQRYHKRFRTDGLKPDFSLNLLDWGSSIGFCIAIEEAACLWNPLDDSISENIIVKEEDAPITSVSWAPDGRQLAIGLVNSHVQLWDSATAKLLSTFRPGHHGRVGSLAWNNHILTTGGEDTQITNNDVRIRSHIVSTYRGHSGEVCGLKWSESGQRLASGGKDSLIHIWDRSMASMNSATRSQWLHKLTDHKATVKALAWCPFRMNLLASGGGDDDKCIKFWSTCTGACVNSVDTGSQVSSLLWNEKEHELLSSHGSSLNQLRLWKYPSMLKMAELTGHASGVLSMAESPNGCTVASAAADETVRLWDVFGNSRLAKPVPKESPEPFAYWNRIR